MKSYSLRGDINMPRVKRRMSKGDKFNKVNVLSRSAFVRQHIPQTRLFNREALLTMLSQYGSVYVKPRNGSFGKGVMKVYKKDNSYITHIGTHVKRHASFTGLYAFLAGQIKGSRYIIQRSIRSIKYHGSIVDFRVVVQLNGRGQAEVTGIAGRVSQGNRVVSNGGGGGAVGDLESFFPGRHYGYVKQKLERLALSVMAQVRRVYPRQTEIGVDIAVDQQLNAWIIEHNYRPDHRMFRPLANGRALRRIMHYGSIYGKRYKL